MNNRRHYRVAQKEVSEADGFACEHNSFVKSCAILVIVFSVIVFVKGIVIGYLISSRCNKKC